MFHFLYILRSSESALLLRSLPKHKKVALTGKKMPEIERKTQEWQAEWQGPLMSCQADARSFRQKEEKAKLRCVYKNRRKRGFFSLERNALAPVSTKRSVLFRYEFGTWCKGSQIIASF